VRAGAQSLGLIALGFAALFLLVRPWGEFPLNDDWQYARVVNHLAQTWSYRVDVPIAPALVVQAYLAAFAVSLFGFSHLLLRTLTIAAAVLLVWAVERTLAAVGTRPGMRAFACALLMTNPLLLTLAFSFMTDIHGYLFALLAVWLWFARDSKTLPSPGRPIVSYGVGLGIAALSGASFWIRQFCVLVYPALVLPPLLAQVRRRDGTGLRRSLPRLLASSALLGLVLGAYFVWSHQTRSYRHEFSDHLSGLATFDSALWRLYAFELLVYMTGFFLPFLILGKYHGLRWLRLALGCLVVAALLWNVSATQRRFVGYHHHLTLPYSGNIIGDLGLGPYTLSPSYLTGAGVPHGSPSTWRAIEVVLMVAAFGWTLWWAARRTEPFQVRRLRHFALTFGLLSAAAAVQAYQREVLDRYYLPLVVALTLALASDRLAWPPRRGHTWWRPAAAVLVGLPLAWFTIAGLHDYFRWNEARWALAKHALKRIESDNLDGGFEVNGWLNFERHHSKPPPKHCIGTCGCAVEGWSCSDDSYQVSMDVPGDRIAIAWVTPRYWLLPRGAVYLTRRR
jgi:hypothetical protein